MSKQDEGYNNTREPEQPLQQDPNKGSANLGGIIIDDRLGPIDSSKWRSHGWNGHYD